MRTDLFHCRDGACIDATRLLGDVQPKSVAPSAIARPSRPVQLLDFIWVSAEDRSLL